MNCHDLVILFTAPPATTSLPAGLLCGLSSSFNTLPQPTLAFTWPLPAYRKSTLEPQLQIIFVETSAIDQTVISICVQAKKKLECMELDVVINCVVQAVY